MVAYAVKSYDEIKRFFKNFDEINQHREISENSDTNLENIKRLVSSISEKYFIELDIKLTSCVFDAFLESFKLFMSEDKAFDICNDVYNIFNSLSDYNDNNNDIMELHKYLDECVKIKKIKKTNNKVINKILKPIIKKDFIYIQTFFLIWTMIVSYKKMNF